jgi:hypothetical protein
VKRPFVLSLVGLSAGFLIACESEADRQAKEHKRIMKEVSARESGEAERNLKAQDDYDAKLWSETQSKKK